MRSITWHRCLLAVLSAALLICAGGGAPAALAEGQVTPQSPDWVEPRALSVFDLVGQVPENVLAGYLVSYGPGGIARYQSGQRNGTQVTVNLLLDARLAGGPGNWQTIIQMPGQPPILDHIGTVAPACWMRLYRGSQEITGATMWANYTSAELVKPQRGAGSTDRYPNQTYSGVNLTRGAGGVLLPANFGGTVVILGEYPQLTAVLTAQVPDAPTVRLVSTQQATFQSYIGDGGLGVFQALMSQLKRRYDDRHPRIMLARPAGANYILFNYAPTPYDPYAYADYNIRRPVGGTVRLAPDQAMLSADLTFGGPFPLAVAWQDADQSASGALLSRLPNCDRMTPAEYVIPAGTPWNDCFLRGDCSTSVLDDIYNRVSSLSIAYLAVTPSSSAVQAVHLEMADTTWQAALGAQTGLVAPRAGQTRRAWLPVIRGLLPQGPVLPTAPVPYGYFSNGRMVGYGY